LLDFCVVFSVDDQGRAGVFFICHYVPSLFAIVPLSLTFCIFPEFFRAFTSTFAALVSPLIYEIEVL